MDAEQIITSAITFLAGWVLKRPNEIAKILMASLSRKNKK
jgi:hypothetical protein